MGPYRSQWMQPWNLLLWGSSQSFLSYLGPFHTPPGDHTQILCIACIKCLHTLLFSFDDVKQITPVYFDRKTFGLLLESCRWRFIRSFSTTAKINNWYKQKHHFTRNFEFCTGPVRTRQRLCTEEDLTKSRLSMLCKEEWPNIAKLRCTMLIDSCLKRLSAASGSCAE